MPFEVDFHRIVIFLKLSIPLMNNSLFLRTHVAKFPIHLFRNSTLLPLKLRDDKKISLLEPITDRIKPMLPPHVGITSITFKGICIIHSGRDRRSAWGGRECFISHSKTLFVWSFQFFILLAKQKVCSEKGRGRPPVISKANRRDDKRKKTKSPAAVLA